MGKDAAPRTVRAAAVLLAALAAACTSLETRIIEPRGGPILDAASLERMEAALDIERRRFQVPDGPELSYRVVSPRAYGTRFHFQRSDRDVTFRFNLANAPDERLPVPTAGTVVLLHGWSMDGMSMLPWALALAERGWHALIVDLRSHGASDRAPVGYGPHEGRDVAALLAALPEGEERGDALVLFGVSYGAVAALYAAAQAEPGLVDAVIALSPYANAADGIRGMIAGMKAVPAGGMRSRMVRGYARMRYDEARIDEAIRMAGERLEVDLAGVDVRQAAAAVPACVLLLHGTSDGFFPMESVQSLADAAPQGQLVPLDREHHFTAPMRMDWLAAPLADWIGSVREGGACPAFVLPEPPSPETLQAGS